MALILVSDPSRLDFIIQMQPVGATRMNVPGHGVASKLRAGSSKDPRNLVSKRRRLGHPDSQARLVKAEGFTGLKSQKTLLVYL